MDGLGVVQKQNSAAPDAASTGATSPTETASQSEPPSELLLREIEAFAKDCQKRYNFNNRWDIVLSVLGILLSIAVVGAGFWGKASVSAVLGAIVGAVLTAQKAFPFGQRATFYRLLIGQSANLITRANEGLLDKKHTVDTLTSLRMDFAQQLPRGSNAEPRDSPPPVVPADSTDTVAGAK